MILMPTPMQFAISLNRGGLGLGWGWAGLDDEVTRYTIHDYGPRNGRWSGGDAVPGWRSGSLPFLFSFSKAGATDAASKCGLSVLLGRSMTIPRRRWRHREIAGRAFPKRPQSPKHTSHLCTEEGAGRRPSHPNTATASDCLLPFISYH